MLIIMRKVVKTSIGIFLLIGLIALIVAVRWETPIEEQDQKQQASIPVDIMEVRTTIENKTLRYIGVVSPKQIQSLSFKNPGKLQQIFVEEGDDVEEKTVLATMDTRDVSYELELAKKAMEAAHAQYQLGKKGASSQEIEQARLNVEKASQVQVFAEATFQEYKSLYEEGVISAKEYDQIELEAEIAQKDFEMATQIYETATNGADKELIEIYYRQYEQAKTQYEYVETIINDATLVSTIRGTIVEIPFEENTRIASGTPVIHIRQEGSNVVIGVTDSDFGKIELNQEVYVHGNNRMMEGKVLRKKNIPDPSTHLYTVEIYLEEKDTLIGEIVECEITIGTEEAIKIPMQAIVVQDESYVYVYESGQARRRTVQVEGFKDNYVVIKGLSEGEKLIVQNVKHMSDGKNVALVREGEDYD